MQGATAVKWCLNFHLIAGPMQRANAYFPARCQSIILLSRSEPAPSPSPPGTSGWSVRPHSARNAAQPSGVLPGCSEHTRAHGPLHHKRLQNRCDM